MFTEIFQKRLERFEEQHRRRHIFSIFIFSSNGSITCEIQWQSFAICSRPHQSQV